MYMGDLKQTTQTHVISHMQSHDSSVPTLALFSSARISPTDVQLPSYLHRRGKKCHNIRIHLRAPSFRNFLEGRRADPFSKVCTHNPYQSAKKVNIEICTKPCMQKTEKSGVNITAQFTESHSLCFSSFNSSPLPQPAPVPLSLPSAHVHEIESDREPASSCLHLVYNGLHLGRIPH